MSYPIWIGATQSGAPVVGTENGAHNPDVCVVSVRVYGSQIPHRCTVRTESGDIDITTPTEARKEGLEIIAVFR